MGMRHQRGFVRRLSTAWAVVAVAALLASCGGGGGSPGGCNGSVDVCFPGLLSFGEGASGPVLTPSVPSETVAGLCDDPSQKQFLRSFFDETYLWNKEVPDADSGGSPQDYFYALRTRQRDAFGQPKDRFSFAASFNQADVLTTGEGYSYGLIWGVDPFGRIRVARVEPNSPAALAGLARGAELVRVDQAGEDGWNPADANASITFVYRVRTGSADTTVTLKAAQVKADPLPLATVVSSPQGRRVGYFAFHSHTRGSQDRLIDAVKQVSASGIQDLVLDLRYNGGGLLYVAQGLASMVAGPASDGKVFERLIYNDRLGAEIRAILGEDFVYRITPTVDASEVKYLRGETLPRLNLPRVYVLATDATCSASESIINGLRGVGLSVHIIGSTSCGKPYGFSRTDNCNLALFPIQFEGVNDKGEGGYAAGFAATCPASDDFDRQLGDPAEVMLGVALRHIDGQGCTGARQGDRRLAQATRVPLPGLDIPVRGDAPGRVVELPRRR